MSKFDTVISTKLGQLSEQAQQAVATGTPTAPGTPAPAGQAAPTATTTPTTTPQQQQQAQQDNPEQALTKVFQSLKMNDPNTAIKAFNTAYKSAGNVPGIKEFFSSLAFDPNTGFMVTKQQPAQGQPQQQAAPNATTPLK